MITSAIEKIFFIKVITFIFFLKRYYATLCLEFKLGKAVVHFFYMKNIVIL